MIFIAQLRPGGKRRAFFCATGSHSLAAFVKRVLLRTFRVLQKANLVALPATV